MPRDRVLLRKVTSHIRNSLGIPDRSCNTKNASIHYLWSQLPQRGWRILTFPWLLVALPFPEEVKLRTLLHKRDNADGLLISINVLEFVTVIINYCAALHTVLTKNPTSNPYPVLLNVTNNASALSWTTGACHKSRIGHLLACFSCSLLINSPLSINSQWISTLHNAIADDISCAKTAASEYTHSYPSFDYSSLQQKYPKLSHCSFFQPAPELISLIWEILLTERWPCHDEIRRLKLRPLGNLTTSSGVQS